MIVPDLVKAVLEGQRRAASENQRRDASKVSIKHYQQAADEGVSIGGIKWVNKWDVCVQCDSREEADELRAAIEQAEKQEPVGAEMTADRASFFLRRFKHDEKMLGSNEQAALDFAIAMLQAEKQEPVCDKCHGLGYYDEGHENDDGTMSGGDYVECEKCKPKQQEPVAWDIAEKVRRDLDRQSCPDAFMRIAVESIAEHYTAPPQRKPLTQGQIREIEIDVSLNQSFDYDTPAEQFCRAIEAAHGIKGET